MSVSRRAPLSGGCVGRVERIDTTAGPFVLKWMDNAPAGFFEAEAAGLEAIRAATAQLVVPRVIAASPDAFLVLEFLPPAPRGTDFDDRLGRALADLHLSAAAQFGFDRDTFCGATRQPNTWHSSWIEFYANQRIGHQFALASSQGWLDASDGRRLERLIDRFGELLIEPAEGPALLHGDLWSGNQHVTAGGQPALLDPAAFFGHREAELALMTLFGGFSARVFDSYAEARPLEPGWSERQPLYQLYHLMNHLNLFGPGYHRPVVDIIRRYA